MLTSAILLTSEPAPAAWLVVLAASWRPGAGRPGRDSTAVTASPFAAKADKTRPRIATTRSSARPVPQPRS
jgi:hypothetical protein